MGIVQNCKLHRKPGFSYALSQVFSAELNLSLTVLHQQHKCFGWESVLFRALLFIVQRNIPPPPNPNKQTDDRPSHGNPPLLI